MHSFSIISYNYLSKFIFTQLFPFFMLQGTFVEGIKEEVVLSPAHALSLVAAGEGDIELFTFFQILFSYFLVHICGMFVLSI